VPTHSKPPLVFSPPSSLVTQLARLQAYSGAADEEAVVPEGPTVVWNAQHVSPELALVDPALAEQARSRLPQPDDTLARTALLVRGHRLAVSRSGALAVGELETIGPALQRRGRIPPRRFAMLAGSLSVSAFIVALLVGVRVDLQGNPAGADTTAIGKPPTVTPSVAAPGGLPSPQERQRNTPSRSRRLAPALKRDVARRLVWAPVAGVSGYHVELFRGSALVFSADTRQPDISIPEKWSHGGRSQTLEPGEYRWYVWTVREGQRVSAAVVQSTLVVAGS